jgi:putative ABC transport system ATP-binding protein
MIKKNYFNSVKKIVMINLNQIEKVYSTSSIETLALSEINLSIEKGEFISIMGPSGCGKSTLLNLMGLLDLPTRGLIEINGTDTSKLNNKDLARMRNQVMGFVFQSFHLVKELNVFDNVELPLLYRKNVPYRDRKKAVLDVLEKVGLGARTNHYPSQLSGGQSQRVAIARAIVGRPQVIFADEPTGNLDSQMGEEVMKILGTLNREGTTIVMVTHDESLASLTHRTIFLYDGNIVRQTENINGNLSERKYTTDVIGIDESPMYQGTPK